MLAHATKNQGRPDLDIFRVGFDVVVDLGCEFPGGREHQDPRYGPAVHHVVGEVVHKRQRECSSFAGAGLCDAHDVTSVEHVRDGLFLNGVGRS